LDGLKISKAKNLNITNLNIAISCKYNIGILDKFWNSLSIPKEINQHSRIWEEINIIS